MRILSTLAFMLVLTLSLAPPATAETAKLVINGDSVQVPVPGSLKNVSENANMPPYALLLETSVVEQWERAGEFSDGMLVVGWHYESPDDAVQAGRFEAMFKALGKGLIAVSDGKEFAPTDPRVSQGAYKDIMREIAGGGVGNVTLAEDTPLKKSYVYDSAFEMPGVVTFPLVKDVSLVRVKGKLIMFHTWRLADKPSVRRQMMRVSKQLRGAIVRANPS